MTPQEQSHLRRAFLAAGKQVRKHLVPILPDADVTFCDVTLHVCPRDNYTERRIWLTGRPPERASLAQALAAVRDRHALILDIGANCGAYALPLARAAGSGSRVIAFEPNPVMIGRLGHNIALNDLSGRIRVESCALGTCDGEAMLRLRHGNLGQASIAAGAGGICVPVRPLRPYLADLASYDTSLLKIDVEGAEDLVLGPWLDAAEPLERPAAILMETAHAAEWSRDLAGEIAAFGYVATFEDEGNTLFERR